MEEFLSYAFMQRALWASGSISITCAILGVFLVLRKDAMIGHGLAHVTFGGVALGLLVAVSPLWVALGVAVFSAVGIFKLRQRAGLYGDTAIAIISSIGMALGILMVSLAGSLNLDIFGYLFGNVLAIRSEEVWLAVGLALAVLVVVLFFYQEFLFITYDPESAKGSGIPVGRFDLLMAVLTAVVIVLGMKVAGILLISALLVIPAAAALQVSKNFRAALLISAVLAGVSAMGGLVVAFYLDWPASGTIVVFSGTIFLILFLVRSWRKGPRSAGGQ